MTGSAPQPGETHLTDGVAPLPGSRRATSDPRPTNPPAGENPAPGAGDGPAPAEEGHTSADPAQAAEARAAGERDATEAIGGTPPDTVHPTVQIDVSGPPDRDRTATPPDDPSGARKPTGPGGQPEREAGDRHDEFTRPTEQLNLDRGPARRTPGTDEPAPVAVPDDPPDRMPQQAGTRSGGAFWLTAIENGEDWPQTEPGPVRTQVETPAPLRRIEAPKQPRRPAFGLLALVVLALLGAFFAWTSAGPLWLAVGHGETGTVTVARCTGTGTTQRCTGTFVSASGWTAPDVAVLGGSGRDTGTVLPARMVGSDSGQAYVQASGWALHVRWLIGVALVLLCGLGIASATGARRLETARARRRAVLASIGAPLVVLAGFLVAAF